MLLGTRIGPNCGGRKGTDPRGDRNNLKSVNQTFTNSSPQPPLNGETLISVDSTQPGDHFDIDVATIIAAYKHRLDGRDCEVILAIPAFSVTRGRSQS